MYPEALEKLIFNLQKLSGVGRKTAERYAFEIIEWSDEDIQEFSSAFSNTLKDIHKCSICGNISEDEKCKICLDKERNHDIICVVQSAKEIYAMEKTKEYNGVYHVLDGVISTTKGILPEQLNIDTLIDRVKNGVQEVIIAINPTIEGETTSLYLTKLLEPYDIIISKIAYGIPMGGHLDYADELTLIKALNGRNRI